MIGLEPEEWKAVDTPVFQRLRAVRQLAMTHLVYPGTTHSRFEHSLGVRHIAGRLAGVVGLSEDDARIVGYAALMHDVGHGPFSHVAEQVLAQVNERGLSHEDITVAILRQNNDIREALGEDDCEAAAELIAGTGPRNAARDIVSGPTDSDKLDYLLRDSYFAGVQYGRYDLERLIDTAVTIRFPRGTESYLGFYSDGVWAIEELLLARHHMHRQVYGHKTRIATDIMIVRALLLGLAEGVLPREAYVAPTGEGGDPEITGEFLAAYLDQTDGAILRRLTTAEQAVGSKDLATRLLVRNLLHQVAKVSLHAHVEELGEEQYERFTNGESYPRERIEEQERRIAESLGCEPYLVALYIDNRANPTYRRPGTFGSKDVLVQEPEDPDHPPVYFQRISELFKMATDVEHSYAYLYLPREASVDPQQAEEMLWEILKTA